MHRTVLRRGHDPLLSIEKCSSCCNMFHCDYCKMLHKHLHQAQNHVANHLRNAVQQEGFVIIKCGLGCRQTPHFHCCYCKSTLIRKDALIKHITTCKNTSDRQSPLIVPAAPPPPSTVEVPPSRAEGPPSTAEVPPPEVPPSTAEVPPFPAASSSAVRLRVRQQVRVACPHCDIQINKKNLLVHINRRHSHTTIL
ncbi:hypothetical protein DPX16_2311 [Anabarilius grahami]|uniref:Uncharacterized protein n=1 Tax=Anabarilius grahami TaxID=495550 RepID=A0A3N0Z2Q0_ANAGA|nr:hypothetical protein DPX16_2311 [Anabarilius grahami]